MWEAALVSLRPLFTLAALVAVAAIAATSLVATLRQQKADVFAAQELTREKVDELCPAGRGRIAIGCRP